MGEKQKTLCIVNGYPRSGKDTFMDYYGQLWECAGHLALKHSTVDTVKEIAKQMGWDGEKDPESRVMLSELKDFYTRHFDGPLNEIKDILDDSQCDVLMVAMREPEEIEKTVQWARNAGVDVQTYLIRGKFEERNHGSHSDAKVLEYDYDFMFSNYGEKNEFLNSVDTFFTYMVKQNEEKEMQPS